ncbi:elongation factor P maturation arginine rhamnosyltransferase EarP [Deefgea rivuli]|uniref:elongation factor P maturation arginine rhamnosyltransferase EarP n=1 Tax=Deefgea rivuli TaxID=400948 RepID=UPI000486F7BE|nr:elongation factor P maturation arginine rhamnosyltransferase EarP [Deefgea rivuli]
MQTWAIFCRVVDNFGDIGVCWRLARQLANEHALDVTLWVDDLASFAKIRPEINSNLATQTLETVTIRHWPENWPAAIPASDVVIETFACDLPPAYIEQMRTHAAANSTAPIWINLDYLSAEDWVSGCHGLPSPQNGLKKYFFFPGFNEKTGGLIGEQSMRQQRAAWTASDAAALRQRLAPKLPVTNADTQYFSLFAYENPALNAWLEQLKDSPSPIVLFVPEGRVLPQIEQLLMLGELHTGEVYQYGAVSLAILPMLSQDDYDRLLWSCDLNFVRGEDSFVRAQWAALPMIWQIYPQSEDTHLEKLDAFLQLYLADLPPELATALRDFYYAWNQGGDIAQSWRMLNTEREILRQHAKNWAKRLAAHGDLATNLVKFTQSI